VNKQEEQQLLRHVRGLYDYKVRVPIILFWVFVGFCALLIGSFLMVGVAGALTRLFS
jgi:hypothetical protein